MRGSRSGSARFSPPGIAPRSVTRSSRTGDGDSESSSSFESTPFYRAVARRRPGLAEPVEALSWSLGATRLCVVHGVYSPKNVLIGEGIWVIGFEVAHSATRRSMRVHAEPPPAQAAAPRRPGRSDGALRERLLGRLPRRGARGAAARARLRARACRLLDGRTRRWTVPAEYLSLDERDAARAAGSRLLLAPPGSLDDALEIARRVTA